MLTSWTGRGFKQARHYSRPATVLYLPRSDVYRFGDPNGSSPVFSGVEWSINEGENWAVVGSGSGEKTALLQTLLGQFRISPPPPTGLFPFLFEPPRDPHNCISLVSFAHRPRSSGGAFYDYTARYGAVRDEDRITLRESVFPNSKLRKDSLSDQVEDSPSEADRQIFEALAKKLGLSPLLDLPLVALSNGQTRRARIVKALLSKPELLVLDEPLTGLDVKSRPALLSLLHSLHKARSPRIILGLRTQDPLPEWITHIALVGGGEVTTGRKEDTNISKSSHDQRTSVETTGHGHTENVDARNTLVEMKNVKVQYKDRKVLKDINWTIREGDRWHLRGANGSGKTTLLSLLTGDHPQSYTQTGPASSLVLFGKPRTRVPTAHLHAYIGVVSPELSNAFPRRAGMTVWDAIATGFDGVFVPLGPQGLGIGLNGILDEETRAWREARMWTVLKGLGPSAWDAPTISSTKPKASTPESFATQFFVDLSAGEQSVVLLMRALVGRPPLVLLDEVWSGMDDLMVKAAHRYLRNDLGDDQAVVVISHWEEEVPWNVKDGVKRLELEEGRSTIMKNGS